MTGQIMLQLHFHLQAAEGSKPFNWWVKTKGEFAVLESLAWTQESPDSSFPICAFMYINRLTYSLLSLQNFFQCLFYG